MRIWILLGAMLGALLGLLAFAPAAWLAHALAQTSGQQLLLADARGTLWSGSAVAVLTGGVGSRDASALPGRLHWSLAPEGLGLRLRARHACCINGELQIKVRPGWGRVRVEMPGAPGVIGQWPAAWLTGLGTPWNTLQPSGSLALSSSGLQVEAVQGRWRFSGQAALEMNTLGSRLSTLAVLGSYRLQLLGDADKSQAATLQLTTLHGALQLSGQGHWTASRFRFNGQAQAAPGSEAVLNNLLNIIGRRQGALAVISIG